MKRLYETIQTRAKDLNDNFDFTEGMNNLFSSNFQGIRDIAELPLEPETSEWSEISGEGRTSLNRTFLFDRHKHLMYFVTEILKESNYMAHHPTLVVLSDRVDVELYTHDINDVSALDLKLADFIDEIYNDIKFIVEF